MLENVDGIVLTFSRIREMVFVKRFREGQLYNSIINKRVINWNIFTPLTVPIATKPDADILGINITTQHVNTLAAWNVFKLIAIPNTVRCRTIYSQRNIVKIVRIYFTYFPL
jgi:hypothetical protein